MKIGDRVICIKSNCGNEGKIGEVVGYHTPNTSFNGGYIYPGDIVVKSLGGPLLSSLGNKTMIGVVRSAWWRKLPDVKEHENLTKALTQLLKVI